jgi:hypothetical protein
VLGPRHMFTVVATASLGGTLESQEKHAEAVKVILPIEPIARQILTGPNASRLGTTLYQLGKARTGLKEYASAETTLLEAHAIYEKSVGPSHPETRVCIKAIIELYQQWNTAEPGKGYDAKADKWRKKLG